MGLNPADHEPGGLGLSLWERIWRDPHFEEAKRRIQARYRLPLPYDIRLEEEKWLGWLGVKKGRESKRAERGRSFLKDVTELFKKFEVPEAWYPDFIAEIAGTGVEEWRRPKFNLYQDPDGNWKWECIITPETDLTNPQILELIQRKQKQYAGEPPAPVKDLSRPGRLQWRSVYEWHKRHPLFTIEEIAKKLKRAPQTLRQRFAELEEEHSRR